MQNLENISISDIIADGQYQGRVTTNTEVIDQYHEAITRGDTFPPVDVYEVGGQLFLVDGFHRYAAHCRAGAASILAVVTRGTQADAMEAALLANQTHGLPRSISDKRLIVERALKFEAFQALSDRDVAKKLCVSAPFIGKMRRQVLNSSFSRAPTITEAPSKVKTFTPREVQTQPLEYDLLDDNHAAEARKGSDLTEIQLLKEVADLYELENEELRDRLAAANFSSSQEDRDSSYDHIKTLREENRKLKIELDVIKISRDQYMQEKSEMIKQVKYWERQVRKYKQEVGI
ncbi:ParB/RepB/Spo0J family partition protein [Limnohabitans sp. Bal53]|uniref:ParB/RepB/Spo0J family partition protein n=1 Tax=Limnohabitans sp. Bal53 TaxID=1977910 RepID=UPI001304C20A|nr:ParB/RepB/Spo0J family partition protein [Limnohabitans sp. Bal53]